MNNDDSNEMWRKYKPLKCLRSHILFSSNSYTECSQNQDKMQLLVPPDIPLDQLYDFVSAILLNNLADIGKNISKELSKDMQI